MGKLFLGVAFVFAIFWVMVKLGQPSEPTYYPSVASYPSRSALIQGQLENTDAADAINHKLREGIPPTGPEIDGYTNDPEMRKALKAFYGTGD